MQTTIHWEHFYEKFVSTYKQERGIYSLPKLYSIWETQQGRKDETQSALYGCIKHAHQVVGEERQFYNVLMHVVENRNVFA